MNSRVAAILRKESRAILREPYTLGIALLLPLVLLFLFAYGVNTDVRNIELVVRDGQVLTVDECEAVTAAAEGNKAAYDKDVKGFVDLAFADMPRIPLFQPYSNVAMQKNVTGYAYWFHRRLDYRAFAKG